MLLQVLPDLYSTVTIDTPTTSQLATTLDVPLVHWLHLELILIRTWFSSNDTFITTVDRDDGVNNPL